MKREKKGLAIAHSSCQNNQKIVNKYETPRYVHGKDSPFEVIVSWVWIMRL